MVVLCQARRERQSRFFAAGWAESTTLGRASDREANMRLASCCLRNFAETLGADGLRSCTRCQSS
jgi:hypothetical protein